MSGISGEPLINNFKIPSWAGKPPPGMHLDVMKEGKLIQVNKTFAISLLFFKNMNIILTRYFL